MARKQHTSGFVYIWRDKKHNRYYVGSHWGLENDGYVCSSTWMRNAHRQRPTDFKRRVVKTIYTNKFDLHEEEHRWLQMMKPEELKGKRYYNICNTVKNHWCKYEDKTLMFCQKMSKIKTGFRHTEETKRKISMNHSKIPTRGTTGMKYTKDSRSKMKEAWVKRRAEGRGNHSPEANEKNRQAHLGMGHTEQTKLKIAESMRRLRSQQKEMRH